MIIFIFESIMRFLNDCIGFKPEPKWEAVQDSATGDGGRFWRVRWSEQDATGRWFYVGHYGGHGGTWDRNAAERHAERLNQEREKPWAMSADWKSK